MKKLNTKNPNTWCPGCPNHMILKSAKEAISSLIKKGYKHKDFSMVTGIGCHAKIFDYVNLSGIYGLHGRVLPVMLGMKLGNPKLKVIGFGGDGDTYSEGLSHFISAGRYNADMTLIIHNNQSFSLTTGQVTPTSQLGFTAKSEPLGNQNKPLNPIKLALGSGATFIARCDANDMKHTKKILEQAIKHKGFSFIDVIQNCLIFNPDMGILNKFMYKVNNNSDMKKANFLVNQWDYNVKKGKIPIGIIYKKREKTFEEKI
jgi:2-oxoglutarate/2-oxoacid ferredoxin oxidoreductase subunit beta